MKLAVVHLGFKGDLLLARFMSTEQGFQQLLESGHVGTELTKWYMVGTA
jgi:Rapamycin-insensitive companion of mTOR RasGEF_N domain